MERRASACGVGSAGSAPTAGLALLINPAGEALLRALLDAPAVPRYMIEVPAFMLADPLVAVVACDMPFASQMFFEGARRL